MATLQELQLKNEGIGEEFSTADLPEQERGRITLQPGVYRFQLPPAEKMANAWVPLENQTVPDGKGGQIDGVTRFAVRFNEDCPLEIVQSPNNERNGQAFRWFCSNRERARNKDRTKVASDMDYVIAAVLGEKHLKRGDNPRYAALFTECAGKQFTATVSIGWYSNPKSDIYAVFEDEKGETSVQPVEGVHGDGKRYYARDIGTDEHGLYPTTVEHEIEVADGGEIVKYTQILWGQNDLSNFKS